MAAAAEFGYTSFTAVQTIFYARELKKGTFAVGGVTDVVKRLTGREPEDIETIARHYIEQSPYRMPGIANKLKAFKKFMQLPFIKAPNKNEQIAFNT